MDGSIDLSRSDRKVLLALYRNGKNASLSRRAHVVLLAAENYSWRTIVRITFSSNNFVSRTPGLWTSVEKTELKASVERSKRSLQHPSGWVKRGGGSIRRHLRTMVTFAADGRAN